MESKKLQYTKGEDEMENNETIRTRIKAKPYPLNWKILNLLKIFNTMNLEGFTVAMEGNYSKHTIRKALSKLEHGEGEKDEKDENGEKEILIYSTRDENKNKIYRLTEKGIKYLNELQIKSGGYEETDYNNWLIRWSVKVGGNRINVIDKSDESFKTEGVEAVKYNDITKKHFALIIEREGESLKELTERIEQAKVKGYIFKVKDKLYSIPFDKIYVVTFYPERESKIQSIADKAESEKSRTKIELFKID